MPSVYNSLLFIHVLVGFVSLVLFWVPIATRKGSPIHVRAGRWYANAMYTVAFTAFVVALVVIIDPIGTKYSGSTFDMANAFRISTRERMFSVFLLSISVLVFTNVRHGLLTLQAKRDHRLMRTPLHLLINVVLGILGVVLTIVGFQASQVLFYIFAGICLSVSIGNLHYCLKKEVKRKEWVIAHLGSMIGAGIGSYTAFFVFGGNQFLSEILRGSWQLVPWVSPAIIGIGFSVFLSRKYRKQYAI